MEDHHSELIKPENLKNSKEFNQSEKNQFGSLSLGILIDLFLICLIAVGIFFRFSHNNWSQRKNLHPDEYGLTSTLTQLAIPDNGDYFNTRISPLSPYDEYDLDGIKTNNGPDNRMVWGQWPIIILRWFAETTGNTGYDELRLMGRTLAAAADTISLFFLFLFSFRLYGKRIALFATALSALAVMQIQQSHFMTVDNFAAAFTSMSLFLAITISQSKIIQIKDQTSNNKYIRYQIDRKAWLWYLLFGITFGMVLASRINLLPLGGMLLIATFISIADLRIKNKSELTRIMAYASVLMVFAVLISSITFRITQPASFRAIQGNTSFFTLNFNPDWVDSMEVAQLASKGVCCGPPSEQWVGRAAILFPWVNITLWGMGLPLGFAAWSGLFLMAWQSLRLGKNWRQHLIPLIWVSGYFFFMGTRFVKSIRYFLPIYPTLCLLAAWSLITWYQTAHQNYVRDRSLSGWKLKLQFKRFLPIFTLILVISGTLLWASAFYKAIYIDDHTRIQASQWIYENVPTPLEMKTNGSKGFETKPLNVPDNLTISQTNPFITTFQNDDANQLVGIEFIGSFLKETIEDSRLQISISPENGSIDSISMTEILLTVIKQSGQKTVYRGDFPPIELQPNKNYIISIWPSDPEQFTFSKMVLSDENWDEGLPIHLETYNEYYQYFDKRTMEVRWLDDENKRQMYLQNLEEVDYIILPSQRGIWSVTRIPQMYPMTIAYYQALFDGSLGFDLTAVFTADFKIGPLNISDLSGKIGWDQQPVLPVYNQSYFAAEEAFSVYDHPPVWIFSKNKEYQTETSQTLLNSIDLNTVINQNAREASKQW
ncbi:MAG: phospholipid carrier-dependent glycosyltransferase [Anaerolineaceae bacterium]|nr:phospholipid carrier-dependent glycosyltransferase [Anaerolineaceae bacterium]